MKLIVEILDYDLSDDGTKAMGKLQGETTSGKQMRVVLWDDRARALDRAVRNLVADGMEVRDFRIIVELDGSFADRTYNGRTFKQFNVSGFNVLTGPSAELVRQRRQGFQEMMRADALAAAGDTAEAFNVLRAHIARFVGLRPAPVEASPEVAPEQPVLERPEDRQTESSATESNATPVAAETESAAEPVRVDAPTPEAAAEAPVTAATAPEASAPVTAPVETPAAPAPTPSSPPVPSTPVTRPAGGVFPVGRSVFGARNPSAVAPSHHVAPPPAPSAAPVRAAAPVATPARTAPLPSAPTATPVANRGAAGARRRGSFSTGAAEAEAKGNTSPEQQASEAYQTEQAPSVSSTGLRQPPPQAAAPTRGFGGSGRGGFSTR